MKQRGISLNNLYVYIPNEKKDDILKYGIKLSENADIILNTSNGTKNGIIAYLSPKDSELYDNDNYSIIRIKIDESITALVFNKICENTEFFDDFICNFNEYEYGTYEQPLAVICSSILPENIQLYNNIIDIPLMIQNSKDYYYEKSINYMMENNKFSKFELYQVLLILGDQKNMFDITNTNEKLKIYTDKISQKKYTKKSNF